MTKPKYKEDGRKIGAQKSAASKCGISHSEWLRRRGNGERHCYDCRKWKPVEMFQKDRTRRGGRASICKECLSDRSTACRYGVDVGRVKSMRTQPCDICGRVTNDAEIDHDHESGIVRGALCGRCNKGLGMFLDDFELLQKAVEYLKKNGGNNGR